MVLVCDLREPSGTPSWVRRDLVTFTATPGSVVMAPDLFAVSWRSSVGDLGRAEAEEGRGGLPVATGRLDLNEDFLLRCAPVLDLSSAFSESASGEWQDDEDGEVTWVLLGLGGGGEWGEKERRSGGGRGERSRHERTGCEADLECTGPGLTGDTGTLPEPGLARGCLSRGKLSSQPASEGALRLL